MDRAEKLLARITERLDLPSEAMGGAPLVQLNGSRQVTVEGHRGIRQYSPERIEVRTVRGCVCIEGRDLHVALLSRDCMVIRGTVRALSLE